MGVPDLPATGDLLWPTLLAVNALGGSASIDEIADSAIRTAGYDEDVQAVPHGNGPQTEIEYRLAWARTNLKGMGLLDNSARGIWSLTEDGHEFLNAALHGGVDGPVRIRELRREWRIARRTTRTQSDDVPDAEVEEQRDWRDELLDALMDMPPQGFERLAQRLLREAGFISATVTGRSGDGGIDGLGVYRLSLVSFPVFYQCKRYRGSVGAGAVRDFRGAMAGRGDKGLLITTGSFTAEAKKEATRDGAPPIDLIDGTRLCDLLKEYELGVRTATRIVEDVAVDSSFFAEL